MCHSEIPTAMRKNWNIKISCIENTIKAINPKQQNGGRKPIQLQNRVEEELNKHNRFETHRQIRQIFAQFF